MINFSSPGSQPDGLQRRQHGGRRHRAHGTDLQVGPIRDLDIPIAKPCGEMRHRSTLLTGQQPTGCTQTRDDAILRRDGIK
jgi:hypothetical protein